MHQRLLNQVLIYVPLHCFESSAFYKVIMNSLIIHYFEHVQNYLYNISVESFNRFCHIALCKYCYILYSPCNIRKKSLFPPELHQKVYGEKIWIVHYWAGKKSCHHIILICIFVSGNDYVHLFIYFRAICISLSGNCLCPLPKFLFCCWLFLSDSYKFFMSQEH